MEQYYFLLASLPALSPDSNQSLAIESFMATASDWLNVNDLKLLSETRLEPVYTEGASKAMESWLSWEAGLRNALIKQRSSKNAADGSQYVRKDQDGNEIIAFHEVSELARAASNAANPFEAELLLLRGRWAYLDSLELGHFFDIEKLIVYKLKILLLQRKNKMTAMLGQELYSSAYEAVAATFPLNLE